MSGTSPSGPGNEPLEDETRIVAENEDHEQRWRGVAADVHGDDEISERVSGLLRDRSRRLLADLLRPHRTWLWVVVGVVLAENAARLSIPYLVKEGIDAGIPPIRENGDTSLLFTIVGVVVGAIVVQAVTRQTFLVLSGRIGQDMLFEIRRRVFAHFQRLSPAFHDEYTSGRVISRQTSDMDAIYEMLEGGFDGLVTAVLTLFGTAILLLVLDVKLALVALLCFPFLLLLTNWFRKESAKTYRVTREKVALVIIHFVESMNGIRAVQAFRREGRNQEIFDDVNDQYRVANLRAFRLVAWFMPGIKLIGNITIAVTLLYGAYLAFNGEVTVGVLAAFLLYLRQFFEPMMEISQFYNTFQSATAALEKLSGVLEEEPGVPEPEHPVALHDVRGRGAVRRRPVRVRRGHARAARPGPDRPGGPDHRPGRHDRRGQDHDRQAAVAVLRPGPRTRPARRHGRARPRRGDPAQVGRDGHAGELHVRRLGRRQHPVRSPRGVSGGRRGGREGDRRPRVHLRAARAATTRTWPTRAAACRPVSASSSRSPGRSWPTPTC